MTDASVSALRQRMIEDMTIRNLAPKTQHGYIRTIKQFAAFLGRSPDTASFEDVRRFQLHLAARGVGPGALNQAVSALRFLFRITLGRRDIVEHTPFVHKPHKLPVVLSPEEVARLLDAAPSLKYRAALSVAYGAGLRAGEVVSLKVSDIDSARMLIRVEQGKGRKDRYVMLSPHLLALLRAWWRVARPQGWLFPGQNRVNPLTTRQRQQDANVRLSLPVLWRPHDHHRGLRAQQLTTVPPDRARRPDQDRHLMSSLAQPPHRKAGYTDRGLSTRSRAAARTMDLGDQRAAPSPPLHVADRARRDAITPLNRIDCLCKSPAPLPEPTGPTLKSP